MKLRLDVANTQEMQLLCNCCRQPYYPNKSWHDRLEAIILGAERYAICPLCTQAPPKHVFIDPGYRRRCRSEVQRLRALYESQRPLTRGRRTRMRKIEILNRAGKYFLAVDGISKSVENEADLLRDLVLLGITRAFAEDAINRLKSTRKTVRLQ